MLANSAGDPLRVKADCGATVELIVLQIEVIPETLVLSPLLLLAAAAVLEDSVLCADGLLCCWCFTDCALLIMAGVLLHGCWEDGTWILWGTDTEVPADRAGRRKNMDSALSHYSIVPETFTSLQEISINNISTM